MADKHDSIPTTDNATGTAAVGDIGAALKLTFDADSGELKAHICACLSVTDYQLKAYACQQGYDGWPLEESLLAAVREALQRGEPSIYCLAVRRDARAEFERTSDGQQLLLTLTPAEGGATISYHQLLEQLQAEGVPEVCVLHDTLADTAQQQSAHRRCVARAVAVEHGQSSRLVRLTREEQSVALDDSSARIDFKQRYDFVVVDVGDSLLRREPATVGTPGMTLQGQLLPATPGKDIPFPKQLDGVVVSPENPNVLLADRAGHPVFTADGVHVDPVLSLSEVGAESGNVDFTGSVVVKGDVLSGYKVKASGDVFIKGTLEKASVSAGGDVVVGGGVAGGDGIPPRTDAEFFARIVAVKSITAKFVAHAKLQSGGDIWVDEYLLNSDVMSKAAVHLGATKGKGQVLGGVTHGDRGVAAKVIGSDAYVATTINVGRCGAAKQQLAAVQAEQLRRRTEALQLQQILDSMAAQAESSQVGQVSLNKRKTVSDALVGVQTALADLKRRERRVNMAIEAMQSARLHVHRKLYPNVRIAINGTELSISSEHGSCSLALVDSDIQIVSS